MQEPAAGFPRDALKRILNDGTPGEAIERPAARITYGGRAPRRDPAADASHATEARARERQADREAGQEESRYGTLGYDPPVVKSRMSKLVSWDALVSIRERLKGIRGKRIGGEPDDESEHFYVCKACGQSVDKRDLFAVFHHEAEGHEPLPTN
jgi:hypothetical protein